MSDNNKETTAIDKLAVVKSEKVNKIKLVKVRALNSLAGKFLLPYSEGQVFEISETQAAEIVESRNGEYVTK